MSTRGVYQPTPEPLAPLPVASSAGITFANDPRGTDRYLYYGVPTAPTAMSFYRYDTWNDVHQLLAPPSTIGGNARFNTGCALLVDPSGQNAYLPGPFVANLVLFHPHAQAPWAQLQGYTIATNAWTVIGQAGVDFAAAGLAAQWGSVTPGAAMAHPCVAQNPSASDDFLYIVGNGTTATFRYQISIQTVAAMNVRGLAAGQGTTATWIPDNHDRVYSFRGNATSVLERYAIAGNAWAAHAYLPATETLDVGTSSCPDPDGNGAYVLQNGTIRRLDPIAATMTPVGRIFGADGTAHCGRLVCATKADDYKFLYFAKHSGTEFQRVRLTP